jgi:hypothetical protein
MKLCPIHRTSLFLSDGWVANFSRLNGSMFVSTRILRRIPAASVFLALAVLTLATAAHAQGTHLWTQSRIEDFEKGTPQGVALSSDGHLRVAPGLTEVLTTPSTFVWSVAVDKSGTAYLGTGFSRRGAARRRGRQAVHALRDQRPERAIGAIGPDGALYVATLPSGKVYRLKAAATTKQDDSSATVVFDGQSPDSRQARNLP